MTLWDLFFTSQPTAPLPQLGAWYFLLPTSLVVVVLLSILICLFQRLSKPFALGSIDPVADDQRLVYCSTFAFSESLPFYHSRMAMDYSLWLPKGSLKRFLLLLVSLAHHGLWFILSFYPYPFPHVSSINNVFWPLGPLGQLLLIYLVQSLPGGRRDAWKICQDDFWGQCYYSAG